MRNIMMVCGFICMGLLSEMTDAQSRFLERLFERSELVGVVSAEKAPEEVELPSGETGRAAHVTIIDAAKSSVYEREFLLVTNRDSDSFRAKGYYFVFAVRMPEWEDVVRQRWRDASDDTVLFEADLVHQSVFLFERESGEDSPYYMQFLRVNPLLEDDDHLGREGSLFYGGDSRRIYGMLHCAELSKRIQRVADKEVDFCD